MTEDWTRPENPVTDHPYIGNRCSGFGGEVACKHWDFEEGRECGRTPFEHRPPKHKADHPDRLDSSHRGYVPRHKADGQR